MKTVVIPFIITILMNAPGLHSQNVSLGQYKLEANKVVLSKVNMKGKEAVKIVKDTAVKSFDEPTFARLNDVNLTNGTIEVKVLSRLLPNAPQMARGFIGVAFRINDSNTKYESIYLRSAECQSG